MSSSLLLLGLVASAVAVHLVAAATVAATAAGAVKELSIPCGVGIPMESPRWYNSPPYIRPGGGCNLKIQPPDALQRCLSGRTIFILGNSLARNYQAELAEIVGDASPFVPDTERRQLRAVAAAGDGDAVDRVSNPPCAKTGTFVTDDEASNQSSDAAAAAATGLLGGATATSSQRIDSHTRFLLNRGKRRSASDSASTPWANAWALRQRLKTRRVAQKKFCLYRCECRVRRVLALSLQTGVS